MQKHKELYISGIDQLPSVARKVLDFIAEVRIVLLYGNLGAGKTTLIQEMVKILGYTGTTSSPSYSLINEYDVQDQDIYHLDLYRLKDLEEALEIGIEDYLYSGNYCFIEWPELILPLIEDEGYVVLSITQDENEGRKIECCLH